MFRNQPGACHARDGAARDVRVIVVVLLADVLVRDGAIHPHVGDGIAVAVGAGAAVAGLRLARVVLASVAVGAGLRLALLARRPGLARRGSVLRQALNTAPVLVCPCADVGARLSVAVVGHGRGRAWCADGGVQPGAGLADAGLPLGGELVAFLGGACLARQVLRVEPGSMCGAALLVACGVLGGVMASGVRLGAVLWCVGSRPAFAGLSALPSSMLLARLSVAVAVGFCLAVRPVLTVNGVLIVRVRGGAAGALT